MASVKLFGCRLGGLLTVQSTGFRNPLSFGSRFIPSPFLNSRRTICYGFPQLNMPTLRLFSTILSPIDDDPFPNAPIADMTNEELADSSTIPGWNLIHSPPRKFPRGALIGTVVSDKMDKTVNVAVVRHRLVPKIRKRLRYTKKFMAHDEQEVAKMGDTVMITPCHRISKNKHFMLREIIRSKGQI